MKNKESRRELKQERSTRERARCCFLLTQQMEYEMPLEAPLRIQFVKLFPLISFALCFTSFNFSFDLPFHTTQQLQQFIIKNYYTKQRGHVAYVYKTQRRQIVD